MNNELKRKNFYLRLRTASFIAELGIKVTEFCDKLNLGRSTYYKWQTCKLELSEKRLDEIEKYISKYGF